MNPRFETINGTLFLMLEKPDAINEFSKTPCVIAGKYGSLRKYFILDFPLSNPSMSMLAEGFEILGYPVEDGSKEWALWQMQQGKRITNQKCRYGSYWFLRDNKVVQSCNGSEIEYITEAWFMERVKTGWQLYEPKPEPCPICNGTGFVSYDDMDGITTQSCSCHHISEQPKQPFANVKKGDFVKHLDGRQLRIVEIKEPACLTSPHVKDRNKKFKCDNGNAYSVVDGSCVRNDDTITRILKPSEVVIQIGCLSGTVRRLTDIYFSLNPSTKKGWVVPEATIPLGMLDPATRSIVEGLLKQMEVTNEQ